jgi:hypothetical protein
VFVALVAALGACGGDSGSKKGNAIAGKSANEILNASARALKRARSVHLEGRQAIGRRPASFNADLERPADIELSYSQKGATASLIAADGALYIKGDAAFWRQQEAARIAKTLANRWVRIPGSADELNDLTRSLSFSTLSRCLVTNHGTLRLGGRATVDGQAAIVIVDMGDRPGSAPGKLFVATAGEPLPLRVVASGRQRPGGVKDPDCNDPDSPTRTGDRITFSRYNERLNVEPPPNPVDLSRGTPGAEAS